jgi:hypothetical protein
MRVIQYTNQIWTLEGLYPYSEVSRTYSLQWQKGYEEATVGFSSGSQIVKNIRNNHH